MIEQLENAKDQIQQLCVDHHVRYMAVFGSAATGKARPDSDIDLLVEFEKGLPASIYSSAYFQLKYELELLLGRPVDLVTTSSLKNPWFEKSVMAEQQALYAA